MVLRDIKPNRSVIPDYCTSFTEQAEYISEYVETVKNEFFQNIGINELYVYESTGEMVVYEGEEKKAFVEKVKNLFGKIWSAIKAKYEKILEYFETKCAQNAKKIGKVTEDDVDYLKDGVIIGKTHEYENLIDDYKSLNIDSVIDESETVISKEDMMSRIFYENFDKKYPGKKLTADFIKDFMMSKGISVDKYWVEDNFDSINDVVINKIDKKSIQGAFKTEKLNVDNAIKKLSKNYNGDDIKDKITSYTNYVEAYHTFMSICMDVRKKRLSEYTTLMSKVAIVASKSENVEESYQVDMVKEAFNW